MSRLWHICLQVAEVLRLRRFDQSTAQGRSQERYRRVLLTSIGAIAARGSTMLVAIISVPLSVDYLGAERYGMWMTSSSILMLLSFADLGVGNGLVNAVVEAEGRGDISAKRTSVSSASIVLLLVACAVAATLGIAYPFVPWPSVYNVTSSLASREAGPATAIIVISFAVNMPLGVVQNLQMAHQEGLKTHLWNIVGAAISLVGLVGAVRLHAGLPWLVLGMTGGPVVARLANWIVEFGFLKPWLLPRWSQFNWTSGKGIMNTGVLFMILQFCALIGSSSDGFVIAQLLGASSVAVFTVTQRLFSTTQVAQYFLFPLWPAMGEAVARGDFAWARKALLRALFLSTTLGMLTAVPLVLAGKELVRFWVGSAMIPSTSMLIGFGFWVMLTGYSGTMATVLNHGAFLKKQVVYYALGSFCALGLKLLLVPYLGPAGSVWATVIGYSVFFVIPAGRIAFGALRVGAKA